jgi:methionyl-tRNA synthetase
MAKSSKKTSEKALKKKFYVTTAIDYVNARPHIGHAYEKTLTDAIVRWHKLLGEETWYLTGTDENAQKNAQVAKEKGIPIKKFIDENTNVFIELCKKLNLSNDDFIRTTEQRHVKVAQEIFKKVYDKGEIYRGKYEGLYCIGCEAFITEKDLVEGCCPEHKKVPEKMSEEAYFFKLSKYKNEIIKFIKTYIVPESKRNEILNRLKEEGLRDLCVSRTGLDWGIDSPIDKKFKIYVWFDALINYYSGASGNWPADVHIVGKGINWFHSVIWPAILMSAGIKLPKKLLVHGYLNIGGEKMSKSLGNVIDPIEFVNKYGTDSVRYSLLKCSVFEDSDYSEEILVNRNNSELADKLGNLVSRVTALAEKYGLEKNKNKLLKKLKLKQIEKEMNNFEIDKALNSIFSFIDLCNEYVQSKKPWETQDKKVLYELVDSIKSLAILLWPFIPETSEKIAKNLGFEIKYENMEKNLDYKNIKKAEILFKKIETGILLEKESSSKKNEKIQEKTIKTEKSNKIEGITTMTDLINYEQFSKTDLRVGTIEKAEDIEGADKLLKLEVNLGKELGKRILLAGIKKYYKKEELKGKQIVVVANLEPRKMKGLESQGMLLAAGSPETDTCILISPEKKVENGTRLS